MSQRRAKNVAADYFGGHNRQRSKETFMEWLAVYVLAGLLGLVTGIISAQKGRSFLLWWFFGTMLFIVALPLALALPATSRSFTKRRNCPYCGYSMNVKERSCPNCKRTQPQVFWSGKSSIENWEVTVQAQDEVEKWVKKQQ